MNATSNDAWELIARNVEASMVRRDGIDLEEATARSLTLRELVDRLTDDESEMLLLILSGYTYAEIAAKWHVKRYLVDRCGMYLSRKIAILIREMDAGHRLSR